MHPPDFNIHHKLSDWPGCTLELNCAACRGRSMSLPIRMLLARHGERTFKEVVPGLRCKHCGGRPAPVYLVAGFHRANCKGPPPCWAVELVGRGFCRSLGCKSAEWSHSQRMETFTIVPNGEKFEVWKAGPGKPPTFVHSFASRAAAESFAANRQTLEQSQTPKDQSA